MQARALAILLVLASWHNSAAFASAASPSQTTNLPWAPNAKCRLNPAHPQGLHPSAFVALQKLSLSHRITQGINFSNEPGNVHQTDVTVDGKTYTGAADISVRCLTEAQVRSLLGRLAEMGFAAWYRNPGQDAWTGPRHIHAVWAGCRLKPILRQQVESWLGGKNGLPSREQPYEFWQPSAEMKARVGMLYRSSN
jgi:hypothetical protein